MKLGQPVRVCLIPYKVELHAANDVMKMLSPLIAAVLFLNDTDPANVFTEFSKSSPSLLLTNWMKQLSKLRALTTLWSMEGPGSSTKMAPPLRQALLSINNSLDVLYR